MNFLEKLKFWKKEPRDITPKIFESDFERLEELYKARRMLNWKSWIVSKKFFGDSQRLEISSFLKDFLDEALEEERLRDRLGGDNK